MWISLLHQLLLVYITGSTAAAKNKPAALRTRRVVFEEINPFVGAIDVYMGYRDALLRRISHRCITVVNNENQRLHGTDAKCEKHYRGHSAAFVCYNIFTAVLMQDKPVDFIHKFVRSRLAEYHALELIFDNLTIAGLKGAFDKLFPALNRNIFARVCVKYSSERDAIRKALKAKVADVIEQGAGALLYDCKEGKVPNKPLVSDDILVYFSLRCKGGKSLVPSEFEAILEAIRKEADMGKHFDDKCVGMAHFLYNIIGTNYNKNESGLATQALSYITSNYSPHLIEMMTQQHMLQGIRADDHNVIRTSAMDNIIYYTCGEASICEENLDRGESISNGDPHFVRAYLEAQRKNGMITGEEEADYLYTFYCNSDQSRRDKLLAVDGSFPDSLPFEFHRRVINYLYRKACRKVPGLSAAVEALYKSNPDQNDRSLHQAKFNACIVYDQIMSPPAGTSSRAAGNPDIVTDVPQ